MTEPPVRPHNDNAPYAVVRAVGPSEVLTGAALIGSVVTANVADVADVAQTSALAAVVLPVGLALSRALKHRAADQANALVKTAQIAAAAGSQAPAVTRSDGVQTVTVDQGRTTVTITISVQTTPT